MTGGLWHEFERVAALRENCSAIIQGERQVTFAELRQNALRWGSRLIQAGMKPGDRCLLFAPNSTELAGAILGAWFTGAILTLVNDEAPPTHLMHAIDVTQPRIAILDDNKASSVSVPNSVRSITLRGDVMVSSVASSPVVVASSEPASIFFTSGSTGLPKGVTQNHATLLAGCRMVADRLMLSPNDRILCPIPWSFDYGYGQLLSTLLLGITQVLPTMRNAFSLCEAIEQHRPTILAGLPSLFGLLFRGLSPIATTNLSSLRMVTNTGGSIPSGIFSDMLRTFSNCSISLNYGLTETYRTAGLPAELAAARPSSVGKPYPGVDVVIVYENGEIASPGEVGEIVHRGTGVFMGYWGAAAETAKVLRPDPVWRHGAIAQPKAVYTGDLGFKDEDGFITVKGRRDRLIKSMGVRVSPDEIAELLRKSGLLRDAAVVGMPDDILGQKVVAVLVPLDGVLMDLAALKRYARQEMSSAMQPRDYRTLESIPLTPNGKPDYPAVRDLFNSTRGRPLAECSIKQPTDA